MKNTLTIILVYILSGGLFSQTLSNVSPYYKNFQVGVNGDTIKMNESQQDSTAIYFIDLPSRIDTLVYEAEIMLDSTKKIHKMKLPSYPTKTTIYIHDTNKEKSLPVAKGEFNQEQEVLLDITKLKKGKYSVHLSYPSNLADNFFLIIK